MAKPTPFMDFTTDFIDDDRYEIFKNSKHRLATARFCLKEYCYDIYTAYMCITYMQLNLVHKSKEVYSPAYLAFVRVFLREKDRSKGIADAPYELNLERASMETVKFLVNYEESYPQNRVTIRQLDEALKPIKSVLVTHLTLGLFYNSSFKTAYYNQKRYANNKSGQELKKYKLRNTDTGNQNLHRNVRETLALAGFPIDYIFPKGLL